MSPDHSDPDEPSREYIDHYEHNPAWDLLSQEQHEIALERDERLHGEVLNE